MGWGENARKSRCLYTLLGCARTMSHDISTHKQLSIAQRHITTISASFYHHTTTMGDNDNDNEGPDNAFASSGPLGKFFFCFSFLILTILSSYRSHQRRTTTTCHVTPDNDTQRQCRTPRRRATSRTTTHNDNDVPRQGRQHITTTHNDDAQRWRAKSMRHTTTTTTTICHVKDDTRRRQHTTSRTTHDDDSIPRQHWGTTTVGQGSRKGRRWQGR